jgi:hypothetical protein
MVFKSDGHGAARMKFKTASLGGEFVTVMVSKSNGDGAARMKLNTASLEGRVTVMVSRVRVMA